MKSTKKEILLISKNFTSLLILVVLSVSCNWNSSEKGRQAGNLWN